MDDLKVNMIRIKLSLVGAHPIAYAVVVMAKQVLEIVWMSRSHCYKS